MAKNRTGDVPLPLLSAALDDIWTLRAAGAYEADVMRGLIGYQTMPLGARQTLAACADILHDVAAGKAAARRAALDDADFHIEDSLAAPPTASEWEKMARAREQMRLTAATVPAPLYYRARDEVVATRELFAVVAHWLTGALSYRHLPGRSALDKTVARLVDASEGDPTSAYVKVGIRRLRHALRRAGHPTTLTRSNYESEDRA